MNSFAQENAEAQGLQPDQLKLAAGRAEKLPLPDHAFDVAVCTLVSLLPAAWGPDPSMLSC